MATLLVYSHGCPSASEVTGKSPSLSESNVFILGKYGYEPSFPACPSHKTIIGMHIKYILRIFCGERNMEFNWIHLFTPGGTWTDIRYKNQGLHIGEWVLSWMQYLLNLSVDVAKQIHR